MHTIINGCVLFLWLQTLTFVKSQDCTLEQFLNSRLYDSNFDTTGLQASYPGGKQVRVSCSVGYSGFFKLICVEGRWQSRGSRCQPVECKLKLPPLEGTQYEPALRSAFSPGDKVKVVCGENYWILNHQTTSTEILCQDDGSWNHTPVCQEIICSNDRDPLLDYWGVSYWSQNKVGDTAFYGCKSGYKSTDGGDEATCTRDGWTPKPLCQAPSHCGRPPTLEDGDTVWTTREQYNQNDRVQYVCQSYYTMEGGPYKTCINGQWTGDIRCLRVTCQIGALDPALIAPSGNEIVRAGEMLLFDCRDDYDLEGDGEVECLGTGEWSGSFPTCSKKCQVPFVPSNVIVTPRLERLSKGETLTFSCKQQGHRIQGSKTIECSDNGVWIGQVPTCGDPSHCGRPPTLEDGDTVGTTREQYNQNARVQYSCQSYYTMEGGPYKTCINGQWTGNIRCLKACTVDREAMTRRNIRYRFSYQDKIYSTHNDEIEFVCTRGSPVGGVGMRQRCLHGVIELPICQ